ncbi:uncharacterized protein LOC125743032 isoform X2 [Brienomyrus brachyistius]|nr:uncharacterized protein LOC125743032 isoform X2 [Brienomyrus brachyistius]
MAMAYLLVLSVCLAIHSCLSQSSSSGQLEHAPAPLVQADPGARPLASIPAEGRYEEEEETHITQEKHYARLGNDSKLGIFLAAALGTLTLMAMVYCIYSQFYNKNPYSHTQLQDDTEMTLDLAECSASFFPGYAVAMDSEKGMWRAGYGSISHAPSIIALPTPQSHLLPAVPFPPLSVSHPSPLQTISAQDLEKSFI